MSVIKKFFAIVVLLPLALIGGPTYAEYTYQLVIPPGAENSQTWGINNAGKVVGVAGDHGAYFTFIYDMKSGEYTDIDTEFWATDISNPGVMVGAVGDNCAIRDKQGNITTFFPPSWTVDKFCNARGVNSNGKVSGVVRDAVDDEFGVRTGFIYDPEYDTYEEFLPSRRTITRGINARGQNVGSVYLIENEAYAGSPKGHYGYLRQTDGSVKYFAISQSRPGQSRARGLSDSGLISGFYTDPDTWEWKGYVTTLSDGNEFEEITLSDDQVVYQRPCDPNVPPPPGPGYELLTDFIATRIRIDGVVVGSCWDWYFNETTGDWIEYAHGFIATPIE
jgi:uncharacterized membrane protein